MHIAAMSLWVHGATSDHWALSLGHADLLLLQRRVRERDVELAVGHRRAVVHVANNGVAEPPCLLVDVKLPVQLVVPERQWGSDPSEVEHPRNMLQEISIGQ